MFSFTKSSCHECSAEPSSPGSAAVAVVGNPNTGKTTLFNVLTGLRQHTGNYPGVTVEKKIGQMALSSRRGGKSHACAGVVGVVDLIDLPGAYSLSACSPDEMIVADVLLGKEGGKEGRKEGSQVTGGGGPDAVLIVADASHLERNLFLVTQVLECGRPVVLALNMIDVAESAGLRIDTEALGEELGCQVVAVSATKGRGLHRLRAAIGQAIDGTGRAARVGQPGQPAGSWFIAMPEAVENAVRALQECAARVGRPIHRVEALRGLLDRHGPAEHRMAKRLADEFPSRLTELRAEVAAAGIDLDLVEPGARYDRIGQIVRRCVQHDQPRPGGQRGQGGATWSDRIDMVLLHPVGGLVVFVAVMWLMFQAIFVGARPLMHVIDMVFSRLGTLAGLVLPAGALRSLVCDGLIAGVGAVLVFLPQVLILFGTIAILEDCGYMARAAFVMDRVLRRCGLSGRSFVPMLACFACAVPGILACRVIDNRRDRLVTILVSPLMSCSARLPVYVLLISAFMPETRFLGGLVSLQGLVLLAMYSLGIVVAIPMAWLFKGFVLRGRPSPFLMEVPQFHWPSAKVIALRMFDRGKDFLVRAGTIILVVALIVWALIYFPHSAEIGHLHDGARAEARAALTGPAQAEALGQIDRAEAGDYVRDSLLGRAGHAIEPALRPLGWDWRIGTAVLASFPAREVVISTLGTIYNAGGDSGGDSDEESSVKLQQAFRQDRRPDGSPAFTPLIAISLMVFTALCCQCAATLAVMKRETQSWRWPILAFSYMTLLAYLGAMLVVQGGRALGFS